MTLDDLKKCAPGETQKQFEKRVEAVYCYSFQPGEVWTLFGDALVVCHPERTPKRVLAGGQIEEISTVEAFDPEPSKFFQKRQIIGLP